MVSSGRPRVLEGQTSGIDGLHWLRGRGCGREEVRVVWIDGLLGIGVGHLGAVALFERLQ